MRTRLTFITLCIAAILAAMSCTPETTKVEAANEGVATKTAQQPVANKPEPAAATNQSPTIPIHTQQPASEAALPPGHPPIGAQSPKGQAKPSGISGIVLEQIPAGKYLYLKLKSDDGKELWTAVLKENVETGTNVTVESPHRMTKFRSPTLGRVFDEIYFGTLGSRPKASAKTANDNPPTKRSALMPKAEGTNGMHIEDLYAQRTEWKDKSVSIRGMVVKYNAEILGANWLHIQDGSGTAQAANHDLVVTTKQTAAVGDEVIIEGKVSLDRDFGAGYSYGLMVENASIQPVAK